MDKNKIIGWYRNTSPKYKPFDIVYTIWNNKVIACEIANAEYGVKMESTGIPHVEWERYTCNELDDTGEVIATHSISGDNLYRKPEDIIARFVKSNKERRR